MRLKRKKITKFIGFIAGFLLTACLYCNSALAVMVPFTPAVLQPRVDVRGTLIDHAAYKPFGEFASSSSYILMTGSHYFTGKELDNSTGLYYYGARYYNPSLGRFIQPDPIVKNVYDSQSLNPYSYCRNNPLRIADPTGMLGEDWSMGGLGDVFGGGYTNYTSSTSHTYSNIMGGVDYGYSNTFGSSWSTAPSYLTAMDFNLSSLTAPMYGAGMMAKPMAVGAVVAASIAWEPANIAYSAYNIAIGKGTWADWVGLGAAAGAVKLVGALSEIASTTSRAMEDVSVMAREARLGYRYVTAGEARYIADIGQIPNFNKKNISKSIFYTDDFFTSATTAQRQLGLDTLPTHRITFNMGSVRPNYASLRDSGSMEYTATEVIDALKVEELLR